MGSRKELLNMYKSLGYQMDEIYEILKIKKEFKRQLRLHFRAVYKKTYARLHRVELNAKMKIRSYNTYHDNVDDYKFLKCQQVAANYYRKKALKESLLLN